MPCRMRAAARRDGTAPWAAVIGIAVATIISCVTGCTSMRSTMLTLTGDGWLVGQSNGSEKRFGMTRPYRGVPVKLKVPAYLRITVGEHVYIYDDGQALMEYKLSRPDRWVEQEIVDVEKVFLVDLARPLSGTSSFNFGIDADTGYFSAISGTITDTSITDVGALVGTVASLVVVPRSPSTKTGEQCQAEPLRSQLIVENRVVAERYFDLADCDLDAQVAAFIDAHVNCSHSCRGHAREGEPKTIQARKWQPENCSVAKLADPAAASANPDEQPEAATGSAQDAAATASSLRMPSALVRPERLPAPSQPALSTERGPASVPNSVPGAVPDEPGRDAR
jgi:hypothetical protein